MGMKKFTTTAAVMLALSASGVSAQGFNTNCTRNYFGDVTCHTAPPQTNDSSLNQLGQIIGTPMPTLQGVNPANTARMLQQMNQQQYLEQHLMQQQQNQQREKYERQMHCVSQAMAYGFSSLACY